MFAQSYLIVSCLSQEFHQLFSSCSYNFPLLWAPLSLSKPLNGSHQREIKDTAPEKGGCGLMWLELIQEGPVWVSSKWALKSSPAFRSPLPFLFWDIPTQQVSGCYVPFGLSGSGLIELACSWGPEHHAIVSIGLLCFRLFCFLHIPPHHL